MSVKPKYDERARVMELRGISDVGLKAILLSDILPKMTARIIHLQDNLLQKCSVKRAVCPHYVTKPGESPPTLEPCNDKECMLEQIVNMRDTYKRWAETGKWRGDTAKNSTYPENVDLTKDGYIEMIVRLEQTPVDMMNGIESEIEKINDGFFSKLWYGMRAYNPFAKSGGCESASGQLSVVILLIMVILILYFVTSKFVSENLVTYNSQDDWLNKNILKN